MRVQVQDYNTFVDFPNNTSPEVVKGVLSKKFPSKAKGILADEPLQFKETINQNRLTEDEISGGQIKIAGVDIYREAGTGDLYRHTGEAYQPLSKPEIDYVTESDEWNLGKWDTEPWIDPAMAFSGGFGAAGKLGLKLGVKEAVKRGAISGLTAAATDYPIGAATEKVQEIAPKAAIPFNIAVGILSGATVEHLIEKRAISMMGGKASKKFVQEGIEAWKANKPHPLIKEPIVSEELKLLPAGQGFELVDKFESMKRMGRILPSPEGEAQKLLPPGQGFELKPRLKPGDIKKTRLTKGIVLGEQPKPSKFEINKLDAALKKQPFERTADDLVQINKVKSQYTSLPNGNIEIAPPPLGYKKGAKFKPSERGELNIDFELLKNKWTEFWKPFSTVPEGEELLAKRYRQFGKIDQAERIVKGFHKRLDGFDAEVKKDVFKYLDGRLDLKDLPVDAQITAKSIKERTITVGKMLVKRGLITQEAFSKHKGNYVHYMYGKHVLGDDKVVGLGPSGKLDISYTKARNPELSLEQRLALGHIEDASIAVPVGMGKALTDIAKVDYLTAVSKNPNWVWQPSIVDVEGLGKTTIGKLVKEVDIYKKMMVEMPSPEIKARFDILNNALETAKQQTQNLPREFKQLPTTANFGPLAGAYVRKPIFDDIVPLMDSFRDPHIGATLNTLMDIEKEGVALFKATHVALNVPTAFRNVVSGIFQNNMRGRALMHIPRDYINAGKSFLAKDQDFVLARKNGLFRTNFAVTEIKQIMDEFAKVEKGKLNLLQGVKNLSKYYGKIDDFAKHAIFVQMRKDGSSVEEALLEAQKWGMDYSLASRSVKGIRRHVIPFASYQYKIAPLIAESIRKRPWVIAKYAAIPTLLAPIAAQKLNNISEEDWKELERDRPRYIRENESYMILPWQNKEGDWQWVNLEYYFPWGNWLAMGRDIKNKNMEEFWKDSGVGNPFLDLLYAAKTGKDPFTQQDISSGLDSPSEKFLKWNEFVYNKWAPSMLTRYGAAGYTARIGEEDKWGKTITPNQAAGRWFGWNMISVTPEQSAVMKKGEIKKLKLDLYRKMTDPRFSEEEKDAYIETFIKKQEDIIEGQ